MTGPNYAQIGEGVKTSASRGFYHCVTSQLGRRVHRGGGGVFEKPDVGIHLRRNVDQDVPEILIFSAATVA